MSLTLFNTLTRKKELFEPLVPKCASMYVCGVTVYDYCHVGHARAYVSFDTLRRYLMYSGYDVNYIQNFTDIDDKIINRAQQLGQDIAAVTAQYIQAYFEDMDQLGVMRADAYPRATDYMSQIIDMIEVLIQKGKAYVANGDVCFSIDTFENYGQLSKKVLEELEAGNRVGVDENKRNPLDFVLWKTAKAGEPFWESPWGKGRPGWHIECSAMVRAVLGETIDIHGGGEDLIFPHHENEIAQSEGCTGACLARNWIHNGFVNIKDEKMSKSLNNFITLRAVLERYSGETLRFFLLKSHYRSALSFTFEGLESAKQALLRLHNTLNSAAKDAVVDPKIASQFDKLKSHFIAAMDDDCNTAEAIGVLFDVNRLVNKSQQGMSYLKECGGILGLFYSVKQENSEYSEEITRLVEVRREAKKQKDFSKADEIRDLLLKEHGLLIEDTPDGVRLKPV